ncbi:MAG: hypothetical protein ACXWCZ_08085 [Flavisolibacter sp.]
MQQHSSSYRDPSGFLFHHSGILYRQVNKVFMEDFDQFNSGGLYQRLIEKKLFVPHKIIHENLTGSNDWYLTLEPEFIPFISYPYEWSFDMLKDAALLTIELAEEAMKSGMMLKDASSFNVQWHEGRMIFIDTLSFEKYDESKPWIAYRQFCEHFFVPLCLMHYLKEPLQNLLIAYPDGIPLQLAKKMLPFKSRFHLNVFLHVHLHASISEKPPQKNNTLKPFSAQKLKNLLRSLKETIQSFSLDKRSGVWSGYYEEAIQREDYVTQKKNIIAEWSSQLDYKTAIDLGANEGEFSQLIAKPGKTIISADFDHYSVNHLYQVTKNKKIKNILPLILDLAHPSPALGVNNRERFSFRERFTTDLVLALALIHHLAIGKNIPFDKIAELFSAAGKYLIVEFIPKTDEKIQIMLQQKRDVYQWYSLENFLTTFSQYYRIMKSVEAGSSKRILYLMLAL